MVNKLINKKTLVSFKTKTSKQIKRVVICFTSLCAFVIICITFSANFFPVNSEKPEVYNKNWQLKIDDQEFQAIDIPNKINEKIYKHLILENYIPSELVKGATVLIRTSQQCLSVLIDEEVIYTTYNESTKKNTPNSAYHFVRLPQDAQLKKITIILSSTQNDFVGILNEVKIGSKASLLFDLMSLYGLNFLGGFILFLIGLFLFLTSIFAKHNREDQGTAYLGAFLLSVGVWLTVESKLLQIFLPFPNMLTNLSIFALSLLPLFLALYFLSSKMNYYHRVLKIVGLCSALTSLILFILNIIDMMLPVTILNYYIFILCLFTIILTALPVLEYRKEKKNFSIIMKGSVVFGVFAIVELLFYLLNITFFESSSILLIGLFFFCIFLFIEFINDFKMSYKNELKTNTYKILAYTDSLTGLKNRTAFLEELSKIDLTRSTEIGIAMFDLNGLKKINDEKGHLTGDYVIMECANFLRSILKDQLVFRLGGDEFVAILSTMTINALEMKMKLSKINENKFSFEIAYGYAKFSKNEDKNLFDTIDRADKEMYQCKARLKKIEHE